MKKVNLGIIGCGMVTEGIHLPVLSKCKDADVTSLVDTDIERARNLAAKYGAAYQETDYHAIAHLIDAAIVAVPHHLHAPVALDLMEQNIHVFVEKPMALNSADCRKMVELSQKKGLVLSVAHVRRLYKPLNKIKSIIDSGKMGRVVSFDISEGRIFAWPVKTFDTFDSARGGGVLTDIGSHVLDLALWWFGDVKDVEYFDDSRGGVEANCDIFVKMKNDIDGTIQLSRTRDLRNTYKIFFEKGTVEVGLGHDALLKINHINGLYKNNLYYSLKSKMTIMDYFERQMNNFIAAVGGKRSVYVPGDEGLRLVEFLERCKANRKQMEYPWEQEKNNEHTESLLQKD